MLYIMYMCIYSIYVVIAPKISECLLSESLDCVTHIFIVLNGGKSPSISRTT